MRMALMLNSHFRSWKMMDPSILNEPTFDRELLDIVRGSTFGVAALPWSGQTEGCSLNWLLMV